MMNIISFGVGQNSTALIIYMYNKGIKIDDIVFSDTGNEMPETYIFLKEFEKWCSERNLKISIVKSKLGSLKEYYEKNKIIPYRMFRHCTHKFKVIPINDYIKEKYGIKTKINMYMGITIEEKHRANKISGRKQFNYIYPLIDNDINRDKCVKIIKKEGLSIPVKSGCYFCPFQIKKKWIELYEEHNDLFNLSNDFEKNCKSYPEGNLMGNMTLEDLKYILKTQTKLMDFEEDISLKKCDYCE